MNEKIKKFAASPKKFVVKHKVGIAVALTALAGVWLNKTALRQHDDFLKEHDLYDAFYTPL